MQRIVSVPFFDQKIAVGKFARAEQIGKNLGFFGGKFGAQHGLEDKFGGVDHRITSTECRR